MAHARWVGDDLYHLLSDSLEELRGRYPQYQTDTIKGKRAYWRKKIKEGTAKMPPKPTSPEANSHFGDILKLHNLSPELAQEFNEQGFHVGFIKNADGEIEYTIPLPNAHRRGSQEAPIAPAVAAHITPSRAKPVRRPYKSLFVFSDLQIGYRRIINEDQSNELISIHDERAMRVARLICKDLQPDEIINLGDTVDLPELSRYLPDSNHFHDTLTLSFQRAHDYYAELRADNPKAKITEVDSNHNVRLKKFILKQAPEFYGLRRPGERWPIMSYPSLANLGHLAVNWISGYGAAEYHYAKDLVFRHGTISVSRGSTAAKASEPDMNVVQGHAHRSEIFYRTTRAGKYLASIVVPALCRLTGEVPGVHTAVNDDNQPVKYQENWQQGVMEIKDYGDGQYQYNLIPINDGRAFYNGREYRSE